MSQRLPEERQSITHKFRLGGVKVYITVGLYDNGQPGEVFLHATKTGELMRGLCSTLGIMISVALQNGVPLSKIVEKLENVRFEPSGFTATKEIPSAASIVDYVAQWLKLRFLTKSSGSA